MWRERRYLCNNASSQRLKNLEPRGSTARTGDAGNGPRTPRGRRDTRDGTARSRQTTNAIGRPAPLKKGDGTIPDVGRHHGKGPLYHTDDEDIRKGNRM